MIKQPRIRTIRMVLYYVGCWLFVLIARDTALCGNVTRSEEGIIESGEDASVRWNIICDADEVMIKTDAYLRHNEQDTHIASSCSEVEITKNGTDVFDSRLSAKCSSTSTNLKEKIYELRLIEQRHTRNLTFVLTVSFENLNDGLVVKDEDMAVMIVIGREEKSGRLVAMHKLIISILSILVLACGCSICCRRARQTAQSIGVADAVLKECASDEIKEKASVENG